MVLPSGFALPPLPYLLALLLAAGGVAALLARRGPPVPEGIVLAFVPWIAVGATLHVLYQLDAAPAVVRPLLGTPAVYLTTAAVAGAAWLLADARLGPADTARAVGIAGTIAFVPVLGLVFAAARAIRPGWSLAGLLAAGLLTAVAWAGLRGLRPGVVATGRLGVLVVFAHALDGVSTAIGVDVFGFGERTPASRAILEFAAALPMAEALGVGWLFVLVKVAVAALVVHLFADYVREAPAQARVLLLGIAAVGLGPGVHNLLLYIVR